MAFDPPSAPPSTVRSGAALPFLSGARVVVEAEALAREFGQEAALAAALRAAQSRARENAVQFCRWREVERLVGWMAAPDEGATRH